jgi:hypothetical protein
MRVRFPTSCSNKLGKLQALRGARKDPCFDRGIFLHSPASPFFVMYLDFGQDFLDALQDFSFGQFGRIRNRTRKARL